jgi:hypothetical protein
MRFSKPAALLVLFPTLLPFVYVVLFYAAQISAIANGEFIRVPGIHALFRLGVVSVLWSFGLSGFYVAFLFNANVVPKNQKAAWALIVFFGGPLAMLIFWFLYIWPKPLSAPTIATDERFEPH